MIKKYNIFLLALVFLFSSFSYSSAEATNILTLDEVIALARQNDSTADLYRELIKKYEEELKIEEQRLGEKYTVIDENGKEITKYRNGTPSFDYESAIKDYKKKIDNIKDVNESKAIDLYFSIIQKEIDVKKKKYSYELLNMDLNISKVKLDQGMILEVNHADELQKKDSFNLELKKVNDDITKLYEDLNELINKDISSRYQLETKSLITKIESNDFSIYVPNSAFDIAKTESDTIKKLMEDLEEKEQQLENFAKRHPKGTKAYIEKEKELGLDDLSKTISNQQDSLYFDMETSYLNVLVNLARLSSIQEDIEFQRYSSNIDRAYYETGMISKRNYFEKEISSLDHEDNYLKMVYDLYKQLLDYRTQFGLNS